MPTESRPIASLFAEAFRREPEIAAIDCVSVTETAAEKLVALTRRTGMILAGVNRGDPDLTLVRHIYDLHLIRDSHYQPRQAACQVPFVYKPF